jgi:hypothetical protein
MLEETREPPEVATCQNPPAVGVTREEPLDPKLFWLRTENNSRLRLPPITWFGGKPLGSRIKAGLVGVPVGGTAFVKVVPVCMNGLLGLAWVWFVVQKVLVDVQGPVNWLLKVSIKKSPAKT